MDVRTASEGVVRALLSEGGVRFGEGRSFRGLTLFPMFLSGGEAERDYLLFAEALQGGHVTVQELGEGVISTLVVHNRGDQAVLLVQGEQILGLRQNRMVNSTVLVGAGARAEVPVACVEQGRWRLAGSGEVCADNLYPRARWLTAEAVTRSVRQRGARDADQTALWREVAAKLTEVGARSSTWAASEAYRSRGDELDEYVRALPPEPGQCGVACAFQGSVACVDLFDNSGALRALYARLVRSYALDALGAEDRCVPGSELESFLGRARRAMATVHPAVGEGEEVCLTDPQVIGTALVARGRVVHLAMFRRPAGACGEAGPGASRRHRAF